MPAIFVLHDSSWSTFAHSATIPAHLFLIQQRSSNRCASSQPSDVVAAVSDGRCMKAGRCLAPFNRSGTDSLALSQRQSFNYSIMG